MTAHRHGYKRAERLSAQRTTGAIQTTVGVAPRIEGPGQAASRRRPHLISAIRTSHPDHLGGQDVVHFDYQPANLLADLGDRRVHLVTYASASTP